jgi:hypothetical protein
MSVIPGRAQREPGIHNHDNEYGFQACAQEGASRNDDRKIYRILRNRRYAALRPSRSALRP